MSTSEKDWIKANSDGSVAEDRFGFGALIRDSSGNCLKALSSRVIVSSMGILELKWIVAGARLCVSHNAVKVWSESDSTTAIT
ncbi:hypothetical protein QJS10_CPB19g00504 [Acorus calamus]|uniref:RNase H type-1 domain-containing protein n=1 Tax=Acorus calamus TaxID=4465 RepID=A0AAV9CF06_ACOCL|nr:hypothetical protein QJS10_CPB19g00504 [Acorus calamus]